MRMTPLDVQSHQFANRFRGYDPDEVDAFLRIVSEDYESLVRETESQGDRIRRLESRVEELSAQENLLKETLVSAQAMVEELRTSSMREADLRLAEVEVRAEKILDASHRRAARLGQDIREMRGLRTRLGETLRSAVETHLALLETLETDSEDDPLLQGPEEGSVAYLRRDLSPEAAVEGAAEGSADLDLAPAEESPADPAPNVAQAETLEDSTNI